MKELFLALLILAGCGKNAELISAPNLLAPKSGNFNLLTNQEVDPVVRDASLLVIQMIMTLRGTQISSQRKFTMLFLRVTLRILYREIPRNVSNYEKTSLYSTNYGGRRC